MLPTYGCYKRWNDEGNDDTLEHVEEELANIADIHGVSLAPWLVTAVLQAHTKKYT